MWALQKKWKKKKTQKRKKKLQKNYTTLYIYGEQPLDSYKKKQ